MLEVRIGIPLRVSSILEITRFHLPGQFHFVFENFRDTCQVT
jgi:hypothetical protein